MQVVVVDGGGETTTLNCLRRKCTQTIAITPHSGWLITRSQTHTPHSHCIVLSTQITITMLKWTVSKRTDAGDPDATYFAEPSHSSGAHPRDHRRRAAASHSSQHIATPQPLTMRQLIATSTPYGSQETLACPTAIVARTPSPLRKRKQQTAVAPCGATTAGAAKPNRAYASTLPSFDVEYSPMAPRCGRAIALRGLTIPDSFFGTARYFPPTADGPPALKRRRVLATECPPPTTSITSIRHAMTAEAQRTQRMHAYVDEEADLNRSSKALDDAELSRMIDDILQSRRKPATAARRPSTVQRDPTPQLPDEDFAFISHKPILPAMPAAAGQRSPTEQTKQIADLLTDHPYLRESIALLAGMSTPKDVRAADAIDQPLRQRSAAAPNNARSPLLAAERPAPTTTSAGGGTTPVGPEQIRRCLTFPESPESMRSWLEKRKSVASTISTTSSRCSGKSTASSGSAPVSGSLNLAIRANGTQIEVHGELV